MFRTGFIVSVCLIWAAVTSSQKFPSDIEQCKYSDSECLSKVATEILRSYSSQGLPGLNLTQLDPLRIPSMVLDKIPGPVSVEFKFKGIDLTGFGEGTVLSFTGFTKEPSDVGLEMQARYPKFVMSGQYSCHGSLLGLPISGQGTTEITFDDVLVIAKAKCTTQEKDGQIYLHVYDVELDIQPTKFSLVLDNLFNGVKLLGDNMNRLISYNSQTVFLALKPLFQKAFSTIGKDIVNSVFSTIPYNELFLPSE